MIGFIYYLNLTKNVAVNTLVLWTGLSIVDNTAPIITLLVWNVVYEIGDKANYFSLYFFLYLEALQRKD